MPAAHRRKGGGRREKEGRISVLGRREPGRPPRASPVWSMALLVRRGACARVSIILIRRFSAVVLRIEGLLIFLISGLAGLFVLLLYLDPSPDHVYAQGLFGIANAVSILYIDKKHLVSNKECVENSLSPGSLPVRKSKCRRFLLPAYLEFILLLTLVLSLDNVFFEAFQYNLDSLGLTEEKYLTFLLIFGGYVLFLSLLPLSAMGAIIIGSGREKLGCLDAIIATSFTFGIIFILSGMRWITLDSFPIVPVLGALFNGNVQKALPVEGKLLMYFCTAAIDILLLLVISSWLFLWGRVGNWRFNKARLS